MAQTGPRNIITRLQDTYITNTDTADHSQRQVLHVGTPDNGTTKYRSFLSFDVAKLRGVRITKATLRVYNSFVSDCDAKAWMGVYPVTQAWRAATVTWANQPSVGAGKGAWFGLGHPNCPDIPNRTDPAASNGIQRIDVTDWVTSWADGTLANHGLRLSAREDAGEGYKDFCSMEPLSSDHACDADYNAPTLEVEFDAGATPVVSGNAYGQTYPGGSPAARPALEFLDSAAPGTWPATGPYQRWLPDAEHSVLDPTLKGGDWAGGTSHKLRPGGTHGGQVLVTGDGPSGFIGVIPYPSLAGYRWAVNVGDPNDLHGVEMLPDGTVVATFATRELDSGVAGGLAVYSKAQGKPGSWSGTPAQALPLAGAHEVLYDPGTTSLWAVGSELLKRYDYIGGRLEPGGSWPLPQQAGAKPAYGHDLTPVFGNTDRLWVGANGGVVQFSKSGRADCYTDSQGTWPLPQYVTGAENRWCTDYPNRSQITQRTLVKSVGNDPVSGRTLTTCAGGCPETQTKPGSNTWETPTVRFVPTSGAQSFASSSPEDRRYKATWAVPAYQ